MNFLKLKVFWYATLAVILALWSGFILGRTTAQPKRTLSTNTTATRRFVNPLFSSQTATIRGQVTKIENNRLWVKNINGREDFIEAATYFTIRNSDGKAKTASGSAELSKIELNKDATLVLELQQNQFKVVSVSYSINPPKPVSTPSAKTQAK